MKDQGAGQSQLLNELIAVRQRVAELEALEGVGLPARVTHPGGRKRRRDVIYACDAHGNLTFISPASEKVLGVPSSSLLGTTIVDLAAAHAAPQEALSSILAQRERAVRNVDEEIEYECPVEVQGHFRFFEFTERIRYDDAGRVVESWGTMRDATDRWKAEEELRESERRYRRIFEESREAMYVSSCEGNIIDANPAMLSLLRCTRDEMIGLDVRTTYVGPEERSRFQGEIEGKGYVRDYPVRLQRNDGTEIDCVITSVVRRAADGSVLGYQGIIRDVTEHKRANEEAARGNRQLAALNAIASAINRSLDLNAILDAALHQTLSALNADTGIIYLLDEDGATFVPAAQRGAGERTPAELCAFGPGEGWPGRIALSGKAMAVPDLSLGPDNIAWTEGPNEARSLAGAPIKSAAKVVGVMAVAAQSKDHFQPDHLELLTQVGCQIGIAIEHAQLYEAAKRELEQRKAAEDALLESEQRYRTFVEESRDAIYITTRDGDIVEFNHAALALFGCTTKEEMSGLNVQGLYARPEDRASFQRRIEEDGFVRDYELKLRKRDGTEMDCLLTASVRRDGSREIVGYHGIIRDITEQKCMEQALRESEQRLSQIIQGSSVATIVIDAERIVTHWNKACERLTGIPAHDMIGTRRQWSAFYRAERLILAGLIVNEASEEEIGEHYRGKCRRSALIADAYECEDFFPDLGEEGRWLFFTASPLRGVDGETLGAVEMLRDITDRKNAEAALKEERDLISATFDTAGALLVVLDPEGRIVRFNRACEETTGYLLEEVRGKHVWDVLLCRENVESAKCAFGAVREGLATGKHEGCWTTKDGRRRIIAWSNAALLDTDKSIRNVIATGIDITGRRRAEEEKEKMQTQLIQAQKMEAVGTLAAGVAHDFNNTLTAIQGYSELAATRSGGGDRLSRDLKQIRTAAIRGADLVRQLLLFGRKQPMEPTVLDINETISGLLLMLDRVIGEDVIIDTRLSPDLWSVQADERSIEQVITNLAVNARDAMSEGGTLTITSENSVLDEEQCDGIQEAYPGRFVCLSVQDTGVGVEEQAMEHIFEPFFTTKRDGKGTGLGLSVVYGIVKEHGGWIDVVSEPGRGATFTIYLPASDTDAAEDAREPVPRQELAGSGERILVVEDEEGSRELATTILEENGYVVLKAASAHEALDLLKSKHEQLNLVLSDVALPDYSGIRLADELLSMDAGLPVVLSSGYTDGKSQWPVIKERGFRFIQKPYSLADLLRTVKEAIASRHTDSGGPGAH